GRLDPPGVRRGVTTPCGCGSDLDHDRIRTHERPSLHRRARRERATSPELRSPLAPPAMILLLWSTSAPENDHRSKITANRSRSLPGLTPSRSLRPAAGR